MYVYQRTVNILIDQKYTKTSRSKALHNMYMYTQIKILVCNHLATLSGCRRIQKNNMDTFLISRENAKRRGTAVV
jgi:hypothetical protein